MGELAEIAGHSLAFGRRIVHKAGSLPRALHRFGQADRDVQLQRFIVQVVRGVDAVAERAVLEVFQGLAQGAAARAAVSLEFRDFCVMMRTQSCSTLTKASTRVATAELLGRCFGRPAPLRLPPRGPFAGVLSMRGHPH